MINFDIIQQDITNLKNEIASLKEKREKLEDRFNKGEIAEEKYEKKDDQLSQEIHDLNQQLTELYKKLPSSEVKEPEKFAKIEQHVNWLDKQVSSLQINNKPILSTTSKAELYTSWSNNTSKYSSCIFPINSDFFETKEQIRPPDISKKEEVVQSWIKSFFIPYINAFSDIKLVDRHSNTSFLNRKPDIVAYTNDVTRDSFNILLIGDVKPDKDFSNEDKGTIIDFMQSILQAQPFRFFIYGFLINSTKLKIFKLSSQNLFEYNELLLFDNTFHIDQGSKVLISLLKSNKISLGYPLEDLDSITIKEYIGSGKFCHVFKAALKIANENGNEFVLKYFSDKKICEKEKEILLQLDSFNCKNIPIIIEDLNLNDCSYLALSPIGIKIYNPCPFPPRLNIFTSIITLLKNIHNHGIIHRDIKPDNLFYHEQTIFLNDWNASCKKTPESKEYTGTIAYSSFSILKQISNENEKFLKFNYDYSDDLVSLIMSIYTIYTSRVPPIYEKYSKYIKYWEDELRLKNNNNSFWCCALNLCFEKKYDDLINLFNSSKF